MRHMIRERITILLARKLADEASPEEENELQELLKIHADEQFLADIIIAYWTEKPTGAYTDGESRFLDVINKASISHWQTTSIKNKNRIKRQKLLVAAGVTGFCLMALFYYNGNKRKTEAGIAHVVTPMGMRTQLLLPDGSKVWLNAGSKIDYDKSFNHTTREVFLTGEAYFDVTKDATRPFIVHTSSIDIKVLGTAFNVSAYGSDSIIEATLVHGLIEITNKKEPGKSKIILHPSEKYKYLLSLANKNDHLLKTYGITPVKINVIDSTSTETAWVHNRLQFDGDTFQELSEKLERWFNITVEIKSNDVAQYRMRGVFEDESINEVLKALQLIAPFKYSINGNKVVITE